MYHVFPELGYLELDTVLQLTHQLRNVLHICSLHHVD